MQSIGAIGIHINNRHITTHTYAYIRIECVHNLLVSCSVGFGEVFETR